MGENYVAVVLDRERLMTLGLAERQGVLLDDVIRFCDDVVPSSSVYALVHRERDRLFPDELFADLFSDRGRRSVPPSVVATVMVLQRLEGLSDREAVERFTFDARWRYAAGVGGYDSGGWGRFAHTVLVDMRARLAASEDPKRLFRVSKEAASAAGLVGAKRVLDSTPLYDAVATMDTITLIRSAIRGLLRVADDELEAELRSVLGSGDDYASAAKPQIDWDDPDSRDALIDSRARDAFACLVVLEGRELGPELSEAAELLAKVVGQDLEETDDGRFRIARRVAKDRVISTVDPEARHGHKTAARGFDGYKGHIAMDPDSEIVTDTTVTPGNAGDASVAEELIDDLIDDETTATAADDKQAATVSPTKRSGGGGGKGGRARGNKKQSAPAARTRRAEARRAARRAKLEGRGNQARRSRRPTVYGDAAYGTGGFLDHLAEHDLESRCKTQPPTAAGGMFAKDRFAIDLDADTVTCPADVTVAIRRNAEGDGIAYFADACAGCPLRAECTNAEGGRTIRVGRYEQRLADARGEQHNPDWADDYRATRPKVERKLGHLMRRKHGGRRARVRGQRKVDADFNLLGAAQNFARLAVLGLRSTMTGWAAAMP
jgi:DDE family transposase/transposase-like protein DUF772